MKIDLDCHSKYSHDSYLEPETIIEPAVETGLDGVCFIEHHSIDAFILVERIKVPDGVIIFRGQVGRAYTIFKTRLINPK